MSLEVNGYNVLFMAAVSFFISLILVPISRHIAIHVNAMDVPNERKVHKVPMPRLGGLAIYLSFLISYMIFGQTTVQMLSIIIASFVIVMFGFIDDISPLRAKYKLIAQLVAAFIVVYYGGLVLQDVYLFNYYINFGSLAPYLTIFFIVACINAINLIDGLDGLATSVTILVLTFFALVSYRLGHVEVAVFCSGLIGALFGFLKFNAYPAKVFMGDTGSLALGGAIASIMLVLKSPLLVIIVGGIYVIEAVSVILQVTYFKATGGKRLFKMAPIHHHFEKCGWKETKVVAVFSIITMILCIIGFFLI